MPIVKSGANKPALEPLPIDASKAGRPTMLGKRDKCAEFLSRCPNATDQEASKACDYHLQGVQVCRARLLGGHLDH